MHFSLKTNILKVFRMRICVFCGSSFGKNEKYREAATSLGMAIAQKGYGLVYGGASVGLMGTLADAVLKSGGEVIGVIPQSLVDVEISHKGLTELRVTLSMHERKAMMAELSDAFAVLPGGIGTLEEAFEIWTWSQLGIHNKPIGLLNVEGYFTGLESFLNHTVQEEFVKQVHRNIMMSDTDAEKLVERLISTKVPTIRKWIVP